MKRLHRQTLLIVGTLIVLSIIWLSREKPFALPRGEKVECNAGVNHALLIGIAQYDKWESLKSPGKDAEELGRILTTKYDFRKEDVTLLTDHTKEPPTRANILNHLDSALRELTPQDNLFIFYSGQSYEDEDGETYWIPKDGEKTTKLTWLKHSELCKEFFASPDLKVKNLCIVTDSPFSNKLVVPKITRIALDDLRYEEKICERSGKPSREVIAFGDRHWDGGESTSGFGLLGYCLQEALSGNWMKMADLENLLFNEKAILMVSKVAGTRMIRGRIRNAPSEKGGQSVITRVISPPKVNVAEAEVRPAKGYAGDQFYFKAKTDHAASEVYIKIDGRQYLMEGNDKEWRLSLVLPKVGPFPFEIAARNMDGTPGFSKKGEVLTAKKEVGKVNVAEATVTPKEGMKGSEYRFTATTDADAASVILFFKGKPHAMEGKGTDWSLRKRIDETGTLDFSVVATNNEGDQGRSKGAVFLVKHEKRPSPLADVGTIELSPPNPFADDSVKIVARTSAPAEKVYVEIEGKRLPMSGSGNEWRYEGRFSKVGINHFGVVAFNDDGNSGALKRGEITVQKRPSSNEPGPVKSVEEMVAARPVPVPDVASINAPGEIFMGEPFSIFATTTEPASKVYIEFEGARRSMSGAGSRWEYTGSLTGSGGKRFRIVASNRSGQEGTPKSGTIQMKERPPVLPDVVDVKVSAVSPGEGYVGDSFLFSASTNNPSESVILDLGGKQIRMEGSGKTWKAVGQVERLGVNPYKVVALDGAGKQGRSKEGEITTRSKPKVLINVVEADVIPQKGNAGQEFEFKARTDGPAKSVTLLLGNEKLEMSGSGDEWRLRKKIREPGSLVFSLVASNQEDIEGSARTAEVFVEEVKQRYTKNSDGTLTDVLTGRINPRFIDHKNGTVTDLFSGLMWTKSPKQVAMNWEDAVRYCDELSVDGQKGWRLPTIEEWQAFIDKSQTSPALPPEHPFSNILTHLGYWSKSRHSFGPLYVHEMNLWYGKSGYRNKTKTALVWPVRYTSVASK